MSDLVTQNVEFPGALDAERLSEKDSVTEALVSAIPIHHNSAFAEQYPELQIVDRESLHRVVKSAYAAGCAATVRSMQEAATEMGLDVDVTKLCAMADSQAYLGLE